MVLQPNMGNWPVVTVLTNVSERSLCLDSDFTFIIRFSQPCEVGVIYVYNYTYVYIKEKDACMFVQGFFCIIDSFIA